MEIKSPITNSNKVKLIKEISTKTIITRYKKYFQIDVSSYFNNLNEISMYECLDTGYKFFYPFGLGGDDDFYGHFKNFSWYYMSWKWEHEAAMKFIKPGFNVLEIGCGTGDFLKAIRENSIEATGLELSSGAAASGRGKRVNILEEKIEEHALRNKEKYDLICLFQVLEHLDNVDEIILKSLETLKPGGKILISVPNDDSFVGRDQHPSLNLPPHHLGLWNAKSLISLGKFFEIRLDDLLFEPLQKYHLPYYYQVNYGDVIVSKAGATIGKAINKIIRPIFIFLFRPFTKDILGHTIIVVYSKKL